MYPIISLLRMWKTAACPTLLVRNAALVILPGLAPDDQLLSVSVMTSTMMCGAAPLSDDQHHDVWGSSSHQTLTRPRPFSALSRPLVVRKRERMTGVLSNLRMQQLPAQQSSQHLPTHREGNVLRQQPGSLCGSATTHSGRNMDDTREKYNLVI